MVAGGTGGRSVFGLVALFVSTITKRDEQFGRFALDSITGKDTIEKIVRVLPLPHALRNERCCGHIETTVSGGAKTGSGLFRSDLLAPSDEEGPFNEVRFKPVVSRDLPQWP